MRILRKIIRRIVLSILLRRGYPYQTAAVAVKEIEEDIDKVKDVPFLKKIALYRKGYYSERLKCYRISKDNSLDNYIPEIRYYKLHPINGFYSKWIDDKLTMRYMFDSYRDYLPEYYYQIDSGRITRLVDCQSSYTADIPGIMNLLRDKKMLAVKLKSGTRRQGFNKFSYDDGVYRVNDKVVAEQELIEIMTGMDDYLVTEFLVPYAEYNKIYPRISNPVRVMVINEAKRMRIIAAFIRFYMDDPDDPEEISPEGVYCGVDINEGRLFEPRMYDRDMNMVDIAIHPDTGVVIEGKLKNWDLMKEVLTHFCNDFPQLRYMGLDIIFTEESFKILEINSIPGLHHIQCYYPMLRDDINREFFERLFKEKGMKLLK